MRSEEQRCEVAQSHVNETMSGMLKESKDYVVNSCSSISLTELKRLRDDDEYEEDTRVTSNPYVRFTKYKDNIEDTALKLATDNVKAAEQLEGDL